MSEYFPQITQRIPYEGPDSRNPLAFKHYDAAELVGGRPMSQHLRFAVAFWHSFQGTGRDPFGEPTLARAWDRGGSEMQQAECRAQAAFEFLGKLGVNFYCFHDADVAPAGESFADYIRNLQQMGSLLKRLQDDSGIRLLWSTANLFSHPRYAHGAATNPDPAVFACAATQVKNCLELTLALGGENYVFWGGREGYETLLNTDMRREEEQLARFLRLAVDYAREIGFTGQLLIEPKPKEPTKHQYDFDASTVLGFLRKHGLWEHFKLNIENNHATLAGHTFEHELAVAALNGKLGSIDANVGDSLLGWDTDQFLTDALPAARCMLVVLQNGGLAPGGLNFDAKLRRGSLDPLDLFYAHIGSMDAFARGLKAAQRIIDDGVLAQFVQERYVGYDTGLGADILGGRLSFAALQEWTLTHGEPEPRSGRQEMLDNLLASYL
jgi:xylose isomerase